MSDVSPHGGGEIRRALEKSGGNSLVFASLVPSVYKGSEEYRKQYAELKAEEDRQKAELEATSKKATLGRLSTIGNQVLSAPKQAGNPWYEQAQSSLMNIRGKDDKNILTQHDLIKNMAETKRVGRDLDSIYQDLSLKGVKPEDFPTRSKAKGLAAALRSEIPYETIEKSPALNLFPEDKAISTVNLEKSLAQKEQEGIRRARTAIETSKNKLDASLYANADRNRLEHIRLLEKKLDEERDSYVGMINLLLKKDFKTEEDKADLNRYTEKLEQLNQEARDNISEIATSSSGYSAKKVLQQNPDMKPQRETPTKETVKSTNTPTPEMSGSSQIKKTTMDLSGAKIVERKTKSGSVVKVYYKDGKPMLNEKGNLIIVKE